ncbi:SRPBCC domain-containing protein [Ramlibacter sp. USB13]|uniref:SRPBCC domain-containing protein n=1 Tax=Ramlibacter cellulosilyticus TaxID=2764187 RepID=A0A923MX66_9BURK|nr:SRPBCC domain-containing protein [Ramlibacter cellulosilyticus]MBC5786344.1 SRPBCC domain-containing protein [Ramlibacter cellulosilyticus]
MDNTTEADRELATERVLPYSRGEVYRAIATPERLARWWGPAGFTSTVETCDFRQGGHWRFALVGPDGKSHPNHNIFALIEPARRVVIRHEDRTHGFRLTISLSDAEGGTRVGWQQVFDDPAERDRMAPICVPANEQNLDRLHAEIASHS